MKTQIRNLPAGRQEREWTPTRAFLPVILGKQIADELEEKDLKKLELFEKGLAKELSKNDTIEGAIKKIVKMALAAEFGPSLVAAKGAQGMIETITRGIMSDNGLRKQALLILDRFAHA